MDVSDGLALDCDRLARQSQVALELTIDALPIHKDAERAAKRDGSTALSHALNDGEDHELIALLPRSKRKLLEPGEPLAGVHVIGRARNQTPVGLILCQGDSREEWSGKGGWQHGA
jgi:thiamine monophosphate kinase